MLVQRAERHFMQRERTTKRRIRSLLHPSLNAYQMPIRHHYRFTGAKSWETEAFPDKHNSPFRAYDSSHTIGGAVMGLDPNTSVLNR